MYFTMKSFFHHELLNISKICFMICIAHIMRYSTTQREWQWHCCSPFSIKC